MTVNAIHDEEDQMASALAELRSDNQDKADAQPVELKPESVEASNAQPATEIDAPQVAADSSHAEDAPSDELKKTRDELQRARSELGRVSSLNRLYNDARIKAENLERENAALKSKPAAVVAEQVQVATDAREKLKAVAEQVKDFPELAGLVDAITESLSSVETKAADIARQAAAQEVRPLEGLRNEAEQRRAQEHVAAYQAAMQVFQSTYPTATETVRSQDFHVWIRSAPKHVQEAYSKGDHPAEAMAVLDAYDAHQRRMGNPSIAKYQPAAHPAQAAEPNQPKDRLKAAAGLPSRASGAKGALPPADDYEGSLAFFRSQRLRRAAQA
jgi:chromosome segregation ATPase